MKINNYFLPMITAICLFCSFGFLRAMELENFVIVCRNGDIERVREYLDEGADPNCCIYRNFDNSGVILPIFAAVCGNHLDVLELLVEKGANVHYSATIGGSLPTFGQLPFLPKGSNVLHLAAYLGRKEIITWLLDEQRMDINLENDIGYSCLKYALGGNNIDLSKWLVSRGATVDHECLNIACQCAGLKMVRWLVEEKDIYPNRSFAIFAGANLDEDERLKMLKYFLYRGRDVYSVMLFDYLVGNKKRYQLSILKEVVFYGSNHVPPILLKVIQEPEGKDLLKTLGRNQKSLEKHINELVFLLEQFDTKGELDQELKATILKEIKKLFDTDETPMYAKQTAVVDLYKLHHAYRNYQVNPIPFEDVVYCLKQILYNKRFFCESDFTLIREFAIKNRIKDIFNRSVLEEAIVFCPSEIKNKIVSHILCNDADLYKNKKLFSAFLAESENEKGFCRRFLDMFVYTNIRDMYKDVSKNISRWWDKEKVYDMCKRQNDFINALALAKAMKRKKDFRMLANFSFVTDALQNNEVVDVPGNGADYSHLPLDVGMHILGFAGVQSFTDKMIFGKKYSKKTVN